MKRLSKLRFRFPPARFISRPEDLVERRGTSPFGDYEVRRVFVQ